MAMVVLSKGLNPCEEVVREAKQPEEQEAICK